MTSLIEVKFIDPVRERGMIAVCDIEAGAAILEVNADLAVMYTPHNRSRCHDCYLKLPDEEAKTRLCAGCGQYLLCTSCTSKAGGEEKVRENHSVACAWFQQLPDSSKEGDTDYVRFMLEYCARVQAADMRILMSLNNLCTNEKSQSTEVKNFCSGFSKLICNHFRDKGMGLDQEHLYLLLLRIKSNCLGFPFSESETLGWAVQEELCMLNHSCAPNAVVEMGSNGTMVLKTARDVVEGEEICISYVHVPDFPDVETRRRHLLETYRFLCKCPKCEADAKAQKR